MVTEGTTDGGRTAPSEGRRARNRRDRERRYLRAALEIVNRDGLGSLTMQALATEVDAAVGTVYTYFPSKGALFAEMQREAIERLIASYLETRARSDALLDGWTAEVEPLGVDVAVARLAVFGHFWIDAPDTLPHEARLLHALVSSSDHVVPEEEHTRVMPAALELLDLARRCVDDATRVGAIAVDDPMNVVIRWAAALTGALLTGSLVDLNPEAFDGPRLARHLQRDLLAGWGVPAASLDRAESHVRTLRGDGPLAPEPSSS
jgi:AcrR family transcriptional regulator